MIDLNKLKSQNVNQERLRKGAIYLNEYCKIFSDTLLNDIKEKAERTNWISERQLELVEKRIAAISLKEISNPTGHAMKYWRAFMPVVFMIHSNNDEIVGTLSYEKSRSIYDFSRKFGYVTPSQFGLLFNSVSSDTIKEAKQHAKDNPDAKEYKEYFEYIKDKFKPEAFREMEEIMLDKYDKNENIYINLFLDYITQGTIMETATVLQETPNPIPQVFLSLKEMRKALAYVA